MMKRILETICILLLVALGWITWSALWGPDRLPERVATHFDAAGNANAWGSPIGLALLPALALVIYLGMTLVERFPQTFNYPVRVTAENRARLEALTLEMIGWIKAEMLLLFTAIDGLIVNAMHSGQGRFPAQLMPCFLALILGTTGWYIAAMIRARKPRDGDQKSGLEG